MHLSLGKLGSLLYLLFLSLWRQWRRRLEVDQYEWRCVRAADKLDGSYGFQPDRGLSASSQKSLDDACILHWVYVSVCNERKFHNEIPSVFDGLSNNFWNHDGIWVSASSLMRLGMATRSKGARKRHHFRRFRFWLLCLLVPCACSDKSRKRQGRDLWRRPQVLPSFSCIECKPTWTLTSFLKVPKFFRFLAIIWLVLGTCGILLVRKNPDFAESKTATFSSQLTFKEGLRTRIFWAIFFMDFCSIFPLFLISQIWKTVGLQLGGMDDYTLTIIGSLGSIANGLSRIFWGPVQDKTSFLFVYRTILVIELIVCLSLYWAVHVSPLVYMIVIFCAFICLGAHFVMFPGLIIKVFGMKAGGQLYSILYIAYGTTSILGLVVYKTVAHYLG